MQIPESDLRALDEAVAALSQWLDAAKKRCRVWDQEPSSEEPYEENARMREMTVRVDPSLSPEQKAAVILSAVKLQYPHLFPKEEPVELDLLVPEEALAESSTNSIFPLEDEEPFHPEPELEPPEQDPDSVVIVHVE